jgi:DNA-binding MarR family transcriptional regulator
MIDNIIVVVYNCCILQLTRFSMETNKQIVENFRSILRKLEREIDIELKGETSCCGVTLSQCHILMELSELGETTVGELSDSFGLDKSTLSRTIDTMFEAGFIERKTNKDDRRYYDLSLTKKGESKAVQINSGCNTYYQQLLNGIPENKRSMIMESINLLSNSMRNLRKEKKGCCAE